MRNKLFCKPVDVTHENEILYCRDQNAGRVSFRSLQLSTDTSMIHNWVNQPYSKRFWGLNGSPELVQSTYEMLLNNPGAHSFIGLFNDRPVCQVDVYQVSADELSQHVEADADDCGLHLLMAPPKYLNRKISLVMLRAFLDFYFSFPMAKRMYAEPDRDNILANRLAQRAGLRYLKPISLPSKKATLYCITREDFYSPLN